MLSLEFTDSYTVLDLWKSDLFNFTNQLKTLGSQQKLLVYIRKTQE